MDELEQIKLKAYKSYKRYKISYGKGMPLSYYEWRKYIDQQITD